MDCIFVDRPAECSTCLEGRKLQCLLNRKHLILRPEAKPELVNLLYRRMDNPERYKLISGELGRKDGQ